MIPWKMFIRSVGAVALLTAGALVAAQEVPFSHASRATDPAVEIDEPTEEEAPDVDPAAEVDDETTTTEPEVETPDTDAPDTDAPDTDAPDTDAPDLEVTEVDDPAPSVVDVPKVKPAKEKAPAVKAKKDCHVTHPSKGDHNNDGHCDQGWHNKDADWVADRGQKPAAAPAADEAKGDAAPRGDKGGRPETAPGQVKKAERHSEAGR